MNHHCPKCEPGVKVVYQPAKVRFWCPNCKCNWTLKEVALIQGGKV